MGIHVHGQSLGGGGGVKKSNIRKSTPNICKRAILAEKEPFWWKKSHFGGKRAILAKNSVKLPILGVCCQKGQKRSNFSLFLSFFSSALGGDQKDSAQEGDTCISMGLC